MEDFESVLAEGKDVAFVIRKGALTYDGKVVYKNDNDDEAGRDHPSYYQVSGEDPVVSTTGKASRELFELREAVRTEP